jgi:hypothetical protein
MFAKLFASAAAVLFCAQVSWAQNPQAPRKAIPDDEAGVTETARVAPALVGTWKAKTERFPLTGDFNEKVWGKDAVSVRDVTLAVKSTGEATLTISHKILDARARVVPGSPSVEQAEVTISGARPGFATRVDYEVRVVKAERRYPDTPGDRWMLDNLRVGVVSFTDDRDALEIRFEPADGQGSFSDLLARQRTAARSTSQ